MKHQALKDLEKIERKAWNTKEKGSEADACTLYGQEGENWLAWDKTAKACWDYRKANGLLGLTWKQIANA